MKRLFGLALLALALTAAPSRASGWPPDDFGFDLVGKLSFRWFQGLLGGGSGGAPGQVPAQLGPWYNYWPYEAHFATPALPQYPYWPTQTLPNGQTYMGNGQ